jgi:hypothetical protein
MCDFKGIFDFKEDHETRLNWRGKPKKKKEYSTLKIQIPIQVDLIQLFLHNLILMEWVLLKKKN